LVWLSTYLFFFSFFCFDWMIDSSHSWFGKGGGWFCWSASMQRKPSCIGLGWLIDWFGLGCAGLTDLDWVVPLFSHALSLAESQLLGVPSAQRHLAKRRTLGSHARYFGHNLGFRRIGAGFDEWEWDWVNEWEKLLLLFFLKLNHVVFVTFVMRPTRTAECAEMGNMDSCWLSARPSPPLPNRWGPSQTRISAVKGGRISPPRRNLSSP